MIVMALEAARQLADTERQIAGYRLNKMSFYKALLVTTGAEGVETQLHLHPHQSTNKRSLDSYNFTLYVYANEEWSSVCEGAVAVEYKETAAFLDDGHELDRREREHNRHTHLSSQSVRNCRESVNTKQFYRNLSAFGFGFGESFQALRQVRYNSTGEATATIKLDAWMEKLKCEDISSHMIHPTALDGIGQLTMAAFSKGSWDTVPTMVPSQFETMWISYELLTRDKETEIQVYAHMISRGFREADFRVTASNAEGKVQIAVEAWREMALGSLDTVASTETEPEKICHHVEWRPDPELLENDQIASLCQVGTTLSPVYVEKWETASRLSMALALSDLEQEQPRGTSCLSHYRQ